MAFPPRFLDELRERTSIADVVGARVKLQRRGRELTGLCPFHNEKTPSFTVSEDKGFYHCFGCGAHGDVISFVGKTEGLSFPEAVEALALKAGMEVPRASPQDAEREKAAKGVREVLEAACAYYERTLRMPEGKAALDYLKGRGLDDDTIRSFRLGYSPEARGALKAALAREDVTDALLVEAGLLKRAEEDESRLYDYFRGRVMFPIMDPRGRVIAFGGRAMGDATPKYLNSPDTDGFHKGSVLYGLDKAREPARKSGRLVVVEGYMDVIALHRAGIPEAVAPLGTALTEVQIELLWKQVPEPTLCFDGDAAGARAAARAAARALPLLQPGRSLLFAALPPGEDPDSLLASSGAAGVGAVLAGTRPLVDMVWDGARAAARLDTPERVAAFEAEVMAKVARIEQHAVRRQYELEMRRRLFAVSRPARTRFARRNGGGAPIPGSVDRPSDAGQIRLTVQKKLMMAGVLAAFVNYPAHLVDLADGLAGLDLPWPDLDRLRHELLNVLSAAETLDAETVKSNLLTRGLAAALDGSLCRDVYALAPYARPGCEGSAVRGRVEHVLSVLDFDRLRGELRSFAGGVAGGSVTEPSDAALDRVERAVRDNQRGDHFAGELDEMAAPLKVS